MKMNFKHIFFTAAAAFSLCACNPVDPGHKEDPVDPPTPPDPEPPVVTTPVPKDGYKIATLWIDLSANIKKLSTKASALSYLDKIQDSGFNAIVLDVKPVPGFVMYDSDFLEKAESYNGVNISEMDYDYLPFFIDECHKRNMRITVSTTVMTMGEGSYGPSDSYWDDKFSVEYLPEGLPNVEYTEGQGGLVDIRNDHENGIFGFLSPACPAVREYACRMAAELVTKYDFDGYALDYCRFQNWNSDFSHWAKEAFEQYSGKTMTNWPDCIYTFKAGETSRDNFTPGEYFNLWSEWKASVIQGFVKDIRETVKAIKPDVDIEYWASAWWPLAGTGQNWASDSKNRTSTYWWGTPDYYKTGFAKYLDIFQLGAYTSQVYGTGTESIQGLMIQGNSLIRKDCSWYGTISAAQISTAGHPNRFDMEGACYLCMKESDGLMVFDLSHVTSHKWWSDIKNGIMKYRNEYEAE